MAACAISRTRPITSTTATIRAVIRQWTICTVVNCYLVRRLLVPICSNLTNRNSSTADRPPHQWPQKVTFTYPPRVKIQHDFVNCTSSFTGAYREGNNIVECNWYKGTLKESNFGMEIVTSLETCLQSIAVTWKRPKRTPSSFSSHKPYQKRLPIPTVASIGGGKTE